MNDLTHKGTGEIETERLLLRRFNISDANEVFREWASHENVAKYLQWKKHESIGETKTYLLDVIGGYSRPDKYIWAAEHKKEGILIGSISAEMADERSKTATMGYCFGERFWNCGYATEALRAVSDYMFYDVNINRLEAYHSVENPASGRVLQKAGFFLEGHMKQKYAAWNGICHDSDFYGLVKDDFKKQYEPEIKEFLDVEKIKLSAYTIAFKCTELSPVTVIKNYISGYKFNIIDKDAKTVFGEISLRLGFSESLYYSGHVGYFVDERYRNAGVATAACEIILNLARAHGFKKILITSDHANKASRRVCEKIGAKLIRIAELPIWHKLYAKGGRFECIYELSI